MARLGAGCLPLGAGRRVVRARNGPQRLRVHGCVVGGLTRRVWRVHHRLQANTGVWCQSFLRCAHDRSRVSGFCDMPLRRSHTVRPTVCTVDLSQVVPIWLGASSAAQPGPGPRRPLVCAREPCPIRTPSDQLLHERQATTASSGGWIGSQSSQPRSGSACTPLTPPRIKSACCKLCRSAVESKACMAMGGRREPSG